MPRRRVRRNRRMRKRKWDPAKPPKRSSINLWNRDYCVPDDLRVKLKYSQIVDFANVAGAYGEYVFRMNSLFDPDFTGVGSQPTGFDQWSQFYKYYRVLGSRIKVRPMNKAPAGGSDAATGTYVVYPSSDSAGIVDYQDACATQHAKSGMFGFYTGNEEPKGLQLYSTIAEIAGARESSVYIEDNYSALVTASPTNGYFWIIGVENQSGSTLDYAFQVDIDFYVQFEERVMLNKS